MEKYHGIFPAFYATYDDAGEISIERCEALTRRFVKKGVQGLYVGGSSGECIYQSVSERKAVLEAVVRAAEGKLCIIAHVAANNTRDSMELAAHAESLGVDAIAAIPPIYFKLPPHAIAAYWNDISAAAPHTDFIIYNIPQLAGVALTLPLLTEMLKNPRLIGVKNSSMPTMDIQQFKHEGTKGGRRFVVFNGPDEQLAAGLVAGADAGIGGTYGVMPELFLTMSALVKAGKNAEACALQHDINDIIMTLCTCHGNLYAAIKAVIKKREGLSLGGVRAPLANLAEGDEEIVCRAAAMIDAAIAKHTV